MDSVLINSQPTINKGRYLVCSSLPFSAISFKPKAKNKNLNKQAKQQQEQILLIRNVKYVAISEPPFLAQSKDALIASTFVARGFSFTFIRDVPFPYFSQTN